MWVLGKKSCAWSFPYAGPWKRASTFSRLALVGICLNLQLPQNESLFAGIDRVLFMGMNAEAAPPSSWLRTALIGRSPKQTLPGADRFTGFRTLN
jgi:hypothetical protein